MPNKPTSKKLYEMLLELLNNPLLWVLNSFHYAADFIEHSKKGDVIQSILTGVAIILCIMFATKDWANWDNRE